MGSPVACPRAYGDGIPFEQTDKWKFSLNSESSTFEGNSTVCSLGDIKLHGVMAEGCVGGDDITGCCGIPMDPGGFQEEPKYSTAYVPARRC